MRKILGLEPISAPHPDPLQRYVHDVNERSVIPQPLHTTQTPPEPCKLTFKVNDFITLKLENGRSNIYVKEKLFMHCKYLLLNIPLDKVNDYADIDSIDEAAEVLNRALEFPSSAPWKLEPEAEFWGHCSNLQAWAENSYDTRILHRNLAFPLLKELVNAGDRLARKVFKEEIAKRIESRCPSVVEYLLTEGYLRFLSEDELDSLDINLNHTKFERR